MMLRTRVISYNCVLLVVLLLASTAFGQDYNSPSSASDGFVKSGKVVGVVGYIKYPETGSGFRHYFTGVRKDYGSTQYRYLTAGIVMTLGTQGGSIPVWILSGDDTGSFREHLVPAIHTPPVPNTKIKFEVEYLPNYGLWQITYGIPNVPTLTNTVTIEATQYGFHVADRVFGGAWGQTSGKSHIGHARFRDMEWFKLKSDYTIVLKSWTKRDPDTRNAPITCMGLTDVNDFDCMKDILAP
ncbi:MAG: hypothetical protein IPM16_23740 [Chloroflexi bacterium]|nr:hypothetical protein [Chloroflexota bacterium]